MRPEKIHKSVAAEEEEATVVPSFFKCPISLELMRDPVVLCTGQSYERSSIEPWLEAGNHTCPTTMQTLASLELVPNHIFGCSLFFMSVCIGGEHIALLI
jgi:hypothetical protein